MTRVVKCPSAVTAHRAGRFRTGRRGGALRGTPVGTVLDPLLRVPETGAGVSGGTAAMGPQRQGSNVDTPGVVIKK
ncbi:hypothetical protein GCM10022205_03300 [Spinactinospora alkalitolerans]